jgi:nucleoside-diphosphate-sugar epimerase
VDCSKAVRELGFVAGSVEEALERAVRWYGENGYVPARHAQRFARAHAA